MKKILFITKKPETEKSVMKGGIHNGWVHDCKDIFDVKFWGKGYGDISMESLSKVIDSFKPDYIYATMRSKYGCSYKKSKPDGCWLPDLTNIKVPKIFVECDEYKWNATDSWYKQFDRMYCRQPWWGNVFLSRPEKTINKQISAKEESWNKIPLFKWSVPEEAFPKKQNIRRHVVFMGAVKRRGYTERKIIHQRYKKQIIFCKRFGQKYWETLHKSLAAICPAESNYGCFVPAKLFEFLASGTAVITNCDLKRYGISELEQYIIKYTNIDSLKDKLSLDFSDYRDVAITAMKNHTHKTRYKELFV